MILGSDFGVLGHMWSQNDVITPYTMVEANSHLNLLHVSILDMNKIFEYIDMLSIGIQ